MELAQLFYSLGIIFFIIVGIFLIVAIGFVLYLYTRVKTMERNAQAKVAQVKDFISSRGWAAGPIGGAITSFIVKMIKHKMSKRV